MGTPMIKYWKITVLAVALLLPSLTAHGQEEPCKLVIEDRLAQLKVTANNMVRLESCNGALVIEMTQACEILETYLNGDCVFPEKRKF
jgi:hypothetical protein